MSNKPFNLIDLTPARYLVIGYFIVILTGTLLLMLPQATTAEGSLGIINALFTSTSATCVTGLIVVNTSTAFTVFGQTVIMILIQVGGLGIMSMSSLLAFLIGKKITLKERLIIQEDLGEFKISGIVRLVRYVLAFTLAIEGAGALLLFTSLIKRYPFWKAIYFSIFHAVSAFNNAGFDLFGNSLEGFTGDIIVNLTVMGLIVLGGIGFVVLVQLYSIRTLKKMPLKKSPLQTKLVLIITLALIAFGFMAILGLEYTNEATLANLPLGQKAMASLFLSVTPRTAGFNTVPTGQLRSSTLFLIIVLMFIGASPGSTGGGIKTTTFGALLMTVKSLITGKRDIEIFNRQLDKDIVLEALAITLLSLALVIGVTMILTVTEKMDFIKILFETVSAYGTVGLSTGITSLLSGVGRVLIIITMFAGRVGPLTLAVALAEKGQQGNYHYPTEKIMVG